MLAMWFSNVLLVRQPNGYAALGLFNAADRWRQLVLFLPASVSPIVFSLLSSLHGQHDRAGYTQLITMNLWMTVATVVIPSVVLAWFASFAMGLFGADYRSGSATLMILATSSVAVVFNTFLGQILVSKGAIWRRFWLDIFLAVCFAFVSWRLIPAYQEKGLALGSLIAYGATTLLLFLLTVQLNRAERQTPFCEE